MILDYPTAWRLVRRGLVHGTWRCSYVQTWGALLCDCGAVQAEWRRISGRADLVFEIDIYGRPAPQGSKNYMGQTAAGRGRMVESSKYVKPWRATVKADALAKRQKIAGWVPLDEALWVEMVFTATRPKSHYRTGRNAHLLKPDAPVRPISKPDASKLARSTEDALTDAGVWRDDCLVVDYLRLGKVYVGEDKDALDSPGVRIRIYREVPADGNADPEV